MDLYVARHGQTLWNVQCKVCGRTDLPLTEEGLHQAQLLAQDAVGKGIDVILASPMLRARQTAQAVAQVLGLPVEIDDRLIEQDYGACEGVDRLDPVFLPVSGISAPVTPAENPCWIWHAGCIACWMRSP